MNKIDVKTLAYVATSPACLEQVIQVMKKLKLNNWNTMELENYEKMLKCNNNTYANIHTVLLAAAQLFQPKRYLEVGIWWGRSIALVVSQCPDCDIVGFDDWMADYCHETSPGPVFVRELAAKIGHRGLLELIGGNSHETLPRYFQERPNVLFDLITVDGDHTEPGAERDLRDVLPFVSVGGIIIFDDVVLYPYMKGIWERVMAENPQFVSWSYSEIGVGIGFGIRIK